MKLLEELFQRRPWFSDPISFPDEPQGMLFPHEASLCYYLARDGYAGRGAIVDAGSFLGKSAFFFARGLRDNPNPEAAGQSVHCFDNFLVNEYSTIEFIAGRLGRTLSLGASTRDLFDAQTAPVREMLDVHSGDLLSAVWRRRPVELLMVDIAKSQALGSRVLELFFPDLIPGESVVIQQDYHHPWLPHIHVVMEHLSDCFDLVAPRVDESAVFRLTRSIPGSLLQRAIDYEFTIQEQAALLDSAISRLAPEDRLYLEMARIILLTGHAPDHELRADLDELERRFDRLQPDGSGHRYFPDIRLYVDEREGWRQKDAGNFARCLELADTVLPQRPIPRIRTMRGCALFGLGRLDEAEREFREALETTPRFGFAYLELGRTLLRQERLMEAEEVLMRALFDRDALEKNTGFLLEMLGWIWVRNRQATQSEEASMRALRENMPEDPEVWALEGYLRRMRGDEAGADASLAKAFGLGLSAERADAFT